MTKSVEPTGLALVDGLSALTAPTIDDYCRAAAEYIRQASIVGSAKSKAAQIRLSNGLAGVTVADLERRGVDLALAFAGERVIAFDRETGEVEPDLPPVGSGLRWEEFIATIADAYQSRFGDI